MNEEQIKNVPEAPPELEQEKVSEEKTPFLPLGIDPIESKSN